MNLRVGAAFIAVFSVVLAIGLWMGWRHARPELRLERDGVITTGFVAGLEKENIPGRRRTWYYASYRFSAAGASFEGRKAIDKDTWSRLEKGGAVRVRFLPESPRLHRLESASPYVWTFVAAGLVVMGGAFVAIGAIVVLRGTRRISP